MKLFSRSANQEVSLTISAKTFFKVLLLIIGTIVLLAALRRASHALLLVFTAFFLALALNAPVSWVARHLPRAKRDSRVLATSLSFLIVVIIIGGFLASLIPPIVRQTQTLISNAPKLVQDVRSDNGDLSRIVKRYHLQKQVDDFSKELSERLKHVSGSAVSTATKIGSSVFSLLTILVLTFMMLIEGPRWLSFTRELLPKDRRDHVDEVAGDMYKVIKGYVNGQVLLAAIAACLLLPGLLIFHVSYPIALMGVVFICGLIPMVGHTIGAVIVSLVALFHAPVSALGILIYYILYQQIENYLIQPRLQANTTNMSPLLVFMSVVVGVSFSGLFGGLVAIPLVGCVRVWVLDYLQTRNLMSAPTVRSEIKQANV